MFCKSLKHQGLTLMAPAVEETQYQGETLILTRTSRNLSRQFSRVSGGGGTGVAESSSSSLPAEEAGHHRPPLPAPVQERSSSSSSSSPRHHSAHISSLIHFPNARILYLPTAVLSPPPRLYMPWIRLLPAIWTILNLPTMGQSPPLPPLPPTLTLADNSNNSFSLSRQRHGRKFVNHHHPNGGNFHYARGHQ